MISNNQKTAECPKAKMIVQAHRIFQQAETAKELFSAAIRAKAAGDESLIKRFQEIMQEGGTYEIDRSRLLETITEEELENFLNFFDTNYLQFASDS